MEYNNLILYRDFDKEDIINSLTSKGEKDVYSCIGKLVEFASSYGFSGNLWQVYISFLLVNNENAYSKACEIHGKASGSINVMAEHDFKIIKAYFNMSLTELCGELSSISRSIKNYENTDTSRKLLSKFMIDKICELAVNLSQAKSTADFKAVVENFYKNYGVGKFGLHKAFRFENDDIIPVTNILKVELDDLVGYDIAKTKIIDNTDAFVNGRKANNCLLFGDAGTGKSSMVKAVLNKYYPQGLRMIEVYKHQFVYLNDIIASIKNRNYKFIIFMDDLSFEEFETDYKYLKAVIEGGLERKPDNVLIYATSNRRHLVREDYSDKQGRRDDLHPSDTVQEKLSLAARFGQSIFFSSPSKKEFNEIVRVLAQKEGISMPEEELYLAANKWELSHSGKSGRTARQFIDNLLGAKK